MRVDSLSLSPSLTCYIDQMASTSKEGEIEAVDAVSIPSDLDNSRILDLQIQLMKGSFFDHYSKL